MMISKFFRPIHSRKRLIPPNKSSIRSTPLFFPHTKNITPKRHCSTHNASNVESEEEPLRKFDKKPPKISTKEDIIKQFYEEYRQIDTSLSEVGARRVYIEQLPSIKPKAIFSNHEIDLGEIEVYGFDFDFVLSVYTDKLQPLIYNLCKEILVTEKNYPKEILEFEYDPTFAIRGLHFDCKKGLLLKLDFVHNINPNLVFWGKKRLTYSEALSHYPSLQFTKNYLDQNLRLMSDLFELSETSLLADTIQYFVDHQIVFDPYAIYRDISHAVTIIHTTRLHRKMKKSLLSFVEKNPSLSLFLSRLKSEGKSLFLLTNNIYQNVNGIMNFLLHDSLSSENKHWTDLFDLIITRADKPNFYSSFNRPFRVYNPEENALLWHPVDNLTPGTIYVDGCLHEMMKIKKWKGRKILYMGDHITNDLVDATRYWGWRTCAIIRELEDAVATHNSLDYRLTLARLELLQSLKPGVERFNDHAMARDLLTLIDKDLRKITMKLTTSRHPNFGCIFKSQTNESVIAYQLLRFADIYTSRVENFLEYPIDTHFIPRRRLMPHDISFGFNTFNHS